MSESEAVHQASTGSGAGEPEVPASFAEERVSVATQWQLMWWRFKKHRLAMVSTAIVLLFYLVVLLADFLAYADPTASEAQRSLLPPQSIHWFDGGRLAPHVFGLTGMRDPNTFKRVYTPDPEKKIPIRFFAQGFEHSVVNMFMIPTAMIMGAKISVADWWLWNQIPVTLGNLVGGFVFTGLALYATYKPATQSDAASPVAVQAAE